MMNDNKLVHDINASISAISQSLSLVSDSWRDDPDLVAKMLPLMVEKVKELESDWEIAKNIILDKG